jgi:hypothetical protein
MKNKIQEQIDKKEKIIEKETKELKALKEKLRLESEKDIWLEIPEKGIKIITKLQFTNKKYSDILKEVNESEIADYNLLQELRNEGFKSEWKKYAFLKDTWAFVPNPDELSKSNGYVARFDAGSGRARLGCNRYPSDTSWSLGVFLVKKILKKGVKR